MTEKFKKIEKEYVLSDSSVNCYGYRLLTSGYQLAEFAKNPIGYYMHDRDGGVVVRWEDLRVEDDRVYAKPCINLSNSRGEQTLNEADGGFLNAASVGHIVVLEYSLDASDMLEGQTGPTIVRWFNRECSLVDIPGNSNALTNLFDSEGNALTLQDLMASHGERAETGQAAGRLVNGPVVVTSAKSNEVGTLNQSNSMMEFLLDVHDLDALAVRGVRVADTGGLLAAIDELKAEANKVPGLESKIAQLETAKVAGEVERLLADALGSRKITRDMKLSLAGDYATNPTGLKVLIDKMPAYQSVVSLIERTSGDAGEVAWQWDDYEKNDPTGKKLKTLMNENPAHYKALFDERFLK